MEKRGGAYKCYWPHLGYSVDRVEGFSEQTQRAASLLPVDGARAEWNPVTCAHSLYHIGLRPPLHAAAGAHATVTLGGFGMHRFAKGVDPGMARALAL